MRPLNVVLAVPNLNAGGAERQVIELASGLRLLGHTVTIGCMTGLGTLHPEAMRRGLDVHCLRKAHPYDLFIARRLAALLRRKRADVLQTFLFGADLWGPFAGRLAGTRVVLTSNRLGGRYSHPFNRLADRLLWRLADGLVCATVSGKRLIAEQTGMPADRIHVVHNGLDFTRFAGLPDRAEARQALGLAPKGLVVAMTATMVPIKNHHMMVRVARTVRATLPDVRFLVIGDNINNWEQEIRRYAAETGVADSILFLGQRTDVPALLPAADVGILCSHWEAFPNAIMEYMACCLPVVATDVGGVSELVHDGSTGYLVAPDDADTMARQLVDLLGDPGRARAMGNAGRSWVLANCDYGILAQKTEAIYREILSRKGRA